jgi:hypothetical protein
MKKFKLKNSHLADTMKTHIIDDMDRFGIWDDNFKKFINERGKRVIAEIEKRLHPEL